jgi:hypothetical protein
MNHNTKFTDVWNTQAGNMGNSHCCSKVLVAFMGIIEEDSAVWAETSAFAEEEMKLKFLDGIGQTIPCSIVAAPAIFS